MPPWIGETAEEVRGQGEPNYKGFEILQDSRIIDMRAWNPAASGKIPAEYAKASVLFSSGQNACHVRVNHGPSPYC